MSRPSPHYNGPLPSSAYVGGVPNKLVWTNQVNIISQVQRPLVPDANINDRTQYGPFKTEYNPYFWDEYKNHNIY